jgi:sucrose-6-phosphate hydrolase SacC (GH32 family)
VEVMMSYNRFEMDQYDFRQKLLNDKHRPKYHFLPPEGSWNDINGTFFHKGRYHLGYLRKIENDNGLKGSAHVFSSWGHISSRDLVHWVYHPTSISDRGEPGSGYERGYIASGSSLMDKNGVPTIFANVRGRGMFVFQSDDDLEHWRRLTEEPVVWEDDPRFPECWTHVMDSDCWLEGDTYYALLGQKNHRPGFEGDSTGLFSSQDMIHWQYEHPFYKSDRRWTEEIEDCACPNFFPFGKKYMLVMHTHLPYIKCQYYIGDYRDHVFYPEQNGQLSYPAALLGGPRFMLDGKGRRLFWGWIRDPRPVGEYGWNGIMTLPWHFTPRPDNGLAISPVEELNILRYDALYLPDEHLRDEERPLPIHSECMELKLRLKPEDAETFGIKLLCSEDGQEETVVTYNRKSNCFVIDFSHASRDRSIRYEVFFRGSFPWAGSLKLPSNCFAVSQTIPYPLGERTGIDLDIFVDQSVIEIFVNSEICMVQRIYPMASDGGVRIFSHGGGTAFSAIEKWEMEATNPW